MSVVVMIRKQEKLFRFSFFSYLIIDTLSAYGFPPRGLILFLGVLIVKTNNPFCAAFIQIWHTELEINSKDDDAKMYNMLKAMLYILWI